VSSGGGGGLNWSAAPASASATGTAGQIAYDNDFFYVATAANTWERAALSTWTPVASIAGLQLWLDASAPETLFDATSGGSLVAADGAVARWEDKSGNGRHATQATSGSRPLRKAAVQGGMDVLRFDGSDDSLSIASSTATFQFLHSQDSTLFIVGKPGTTANPNAVYVFVDNNGRSNNVGFSFWYDDRVSQTRNDMPITISANGSVAVFQNADAVSGNKFTANTFSLISIVSTPDAATASRVALRTNGGASFGGNTQTGSVSASGATGDLHIGGNINDGELLNGDIAEIIIYDTALSDTDRAAVEAYLISKWAIT
jgi:hypothetical protein